MFAKGGNELGGKWDGNLIFEQKREAFAELDDDLGVELAQEVDFDEADVVTGQVTRACGACFGHAREISRSNATG